MKKTMRTVRGLGFGAAVAVALAFGARAAVAEARPCPLTAFGSCNNQDQCVRTCTNAGYPVGQGCVNGCCYCQFV